MNTVVVLLAAIACAVAEPQLLFRNDLPFIHDYRSTIHPFTWPLRTDIPVVSTPIVSTPIVKTLPVGLKTQYYDRDLIGQARYGHIEPGQSHHAVQDALGNKAGSFSYYDTEGKLVETSYIADSAGYRASTKEHILDKLVTPITIGETPDVKLAKIVSLKDLEKIKLRSKRDLVVSPHHIIPSVIPRFEYRFASPPALPTTITKPVLKSDGFLDDTPEVKFAKDRHLFGVEAAKFRNSLTPYTYPYFRYAPLIY